MVEELVGEYILAHTTLQKGVDLFIGALPGDFSEGCAVQTHTNNGSRGSLNFALMTVVMFYSQYATGNDLAISIQKALQLQVGAEDGNFAVLDPVTMRYYGLDSLGRNLFAVTFQICYDAETL